MVRYQKIRKNKIFLGFSPLLLLLFFVSFWACRQKTLGIFLYETYENTEKSTENHNQNYAQRDTSPLTPKGGIIKDTLAIKKEIKDILVKKDTQNLKKLDATLDTTKELITKKMPLQINPIDTSKKATEIPQNLTKKTENPQDSELISAQKMAFMLDSLINVREKAKYLTSQPNLTNANPINTNPNFYPNTILPQEKQTTINNYYYYTNPSPKGETKDTLNDKKEVFVSKKALDSLKVVHDSLKILLEKMIKDTLKSSPIPKEIIKDTVFIRKDTLSLKSTLTPKTEKKDTTFIKKDILKSTLTPKGEIKDTTFIKKDTLKTPPLGVGGLKIIAYYSISEVQPLNSKEVFEALDNLEKNNKKVVKIHISGYTDRQGRTEVNKKLSQNRVLLLKDYLVRNNIDEKMIFMQYFGQKYASQEINPKERRVEIVVIMN